MAFRVTGSQGALEAPYIGDVPYEWNGHIVKINSLFRHLDTLNPSSIERKAVKRLLFQQINLLYRQCASAVPKAFNDDLCFTRAEEVARKGLFSQFPGSENRLKPLAINYLDVYSRFKGAIVEQSSDILPSLRDLAQAHQCFFKQYSAEIQHLKGNDGEVVAVTHEKQIRQGVIAFWYAVDKQNKAVFARMASKIEERDPEVILILPNLLVYFLACRPQQPIPAFLAKYTVGIGMLRNQFKDLSSDEQLLINRSLFGEEVQLSIKGQGALIKIKEVGTLCHRNDQAQLASGFLNALLSALDQFHLSMKYTLSSLAQRSDLLLKDPDAFLRLNPYEQTMLLWLISDQPFSQEVFPKHSSWSGFQEAKERFGKLTSEEQSQFIHNVVTKAGSANAAQKILKGDFDYFANKLNVQDEGGILAMQIRFAIKSLSG
ncbi:MAG: hypothetical protein JSR57_08785 [Verrucomicrobia bacterium]|nr:hypothetical protein [Verrucomicrobiota bacterium]